MVLLQTHRDAIPQTYVPRAIELLHVSDYPSLMKTLILSQEDVRSVLTMDKALDAVEKAFIAHGEGSALMPSKVYLDIPDHKGDFRAMPARLKDAAGVKWVNSHPSNPVEHQLPSVMGLYVLSDPATAYPLAIMDATFLTAIRTGAAAGVASRALAKPASKTLGLVGCGVQAHFLIEAHRAIFGTELEVFVADHSAEKANNFASKYGATAVPIDQASSCHIVCTSTPVRSPIVSRSWISNGSHINAVGADAPGKQELDTQILIDGKIVIDEHHQAMSSGEINVPIRAGKLKDDNIHATIGEILTKKMVGREADEITIFDSTGLAIQDVACAEIAFTKAKEAGIGVSVDIVCA
ncbi:MAG: ornithine cyclodeaminase family protein [Myxococcota bacterium]